MPIELPVVLLIAVAAFVVASTVAQRAGTHADLKAGRPVDVEAERRGPLGAAADVVDRSVAAYLIRQRLGLSTLTRTERRAEAERAAAITRADEIRRMRTGAPAAAAPKRLVVAGSATAHAASVTPVRTTLSVELLAAGLGLAVVILVVIGIWPRETGSVLSVTATPAPSAVESATPTPLPTLPP
jgi:hypothetical protein